MSTLEMSYDRPLYKCTSTLLIFDYIFYLFVRLFLQDYL